MNARAILHVDMDAFYASVEERDRPELAGRPLIVGFAGRRGVVAAANYPVRRYGVHSAMPIGAALALCPDAIVVPPRMGRYREVSEAIFRVFSSVTPLVEPLSLDEAFLDVSGSVRLLGKPAAIGAEIRRRIRAQTGLAASVGVAPNKLVAKIASDLAKPDGLCELTAGDLPAALDALPIERLWGIGPKTLPGVQAAGILNFGDLRRADEATLHRLFGKHADAMRRRASGTDDRAVNPDRDEKSISAEKTFEEDIGDHGQLHAELSRLADRTATRLRSAGLKAAVVTIKVRLADFSTHTRRRSFAPATHATAMVAGVAAELLTAWLAVHPRAAVRLLGVAVADLSPLAQQDLFADGTVQDSRLDVAVDEVRRRFGPALLLRASHLTRTPG